MILSSIALLRDIRASAGRCQARARRRRRNRLPVANFADANPRDPIGESVDGQSLMNRGHLLGISFIHHACLPLEERPQLKSIAMRQTPSQRIEKRTQQRENENKNEIKDPENLRSVEKGKENAAKRDGKVDGVLLGRAGTVDAVENEIERERALRRFCLRGRLSRALVVLDGT